MSTINANLQAQLGTRLNTTNSSEASGAAPVDFAYWHDVFDQAHGQGMSQASSAPHDQGLADDGRASTHEQTSGQTAAPRPMLAEQDHATLNSARPSAPNLQTPSGEHATTPAQALAWQTESSPTPAGTSPRSKGRVSLDAQASRVAWQTASELQSEAHRRQQSLNAHLLRTASGELHVTLRSQTSLSTAQALNAVAQGTQDLGPVTQVLLNGHRIYQAAPTVTHDQTARHKFELDC